MFKFHLAIRKMIMMMVYALPVFAGDIRIACPYAGPITDVYKNDEQKLNLKDHSLLKGVFFQWLNPNRYQWNLFAYQASGINYSTLWGGHFIFDYYPFTRGRGKWVAGMGIEYLQIDMDADNRIPPLTDMELTNRIGIPYVRFGYSHSLNDGKAALSIMPWIGAEYERTAGDLKIVMDPPGPAPVIVQMGKIDENRFLGMAGLNFNATLFHFLGLEAKYHGTFDAKDYYSNANAMVNVFFSRQWGVSYRVKYMEMEKGSDFYNIFGMAFVF